MFSPHQRETDRPQVGGVPLIIRSISFRRSTFDALKEYMRQHERETGETLSNGAALDRIIRGQLVACGGRPQ